MSKLKKLVATASVALKRLVGIDRIQQKENAADRISSTYSRFHNFSDTTRSCYLFLTGKGEACCWSKHHGIWSQMKSGWFWTWESSTSRASPCREATMNTRRRRLGTPNAVIHKEFISEVLHCTLLQLLYLVVKILHLSWSANWYSKLGRNKCLREKKDSNLKQNNAVMWIWYIQDIQYSVENSQGGGKLVDSLSN